MKALVLDRPGSPQTLRLAQMPVPEAGAGEVRVQVHAVGLNPVDYKLAASGSARWQYPFILGLDVAGVVNAVGADVTKGCWRCRRLCGSASVTDWFRGGAIRSGISQ